MSSLDELHALLLDINKPFDNEKSTLKDISFGITHNTSLGFTDDLRDFTVFQPFGEWPTGPLKTTIDATIKGGTPVNFPSPLQAAFKDVLNHGKSTEECFIDIVTMDKPNGLFFGQGDNASGDEKTKSLQKAIADAINGVTNTNAKITVRILSGSGFNTSFDQFKPIIEDMFWPGPGKTRLIKDKPNATLYLGYYSPTFDIEKYPEPIDKLRTLVQSNIEGIKSMSAWLKKTLGVDTLALDGALDFLIKGADSQIVALTRKQIESLSWTHGKVLAVNGKTLMTGGANFWHQSGADVYHIIEQQAKVEGDSAVAAHKWCDYFFRYLNKPHRPDTTSFCKAINLNQDKPQWLEPRPDVPMSDFKLKTTDGKFKILTTSQIGDWHKPDASFDYPVQAIQAVKDLLSNIVWQYLSTDSWIKDPQWKQGLTVIGVPVQGVAAILIDALFTEQQNAREHLGTAIGVTLPNPYTRFNVNPTAWASRMTRLNAIANAKKSVVLCQHRLILWDQTGLQKEKDRINEFLGEERKWSGNLWPFDLLIAIGYALARTRGTNTGSATIQINLSVEQKEVVANSQDGWGDDMDVREFKKRLAMVMNAMAWLDEVAQEDSPTNSLINMMAGSKGVTSARVKALGETGEVFPKVKPIPMAEVKQYINDHVEVRRTLANEKGDGPSKDPNRYNHSKVVVVDDQLMYIGSDNTYPAYCEEHGIWIEDTQAIKQWKEKIFNQLWKRSYVDK
ncbi:hypothetical protein BT63DRAFT_478411 [Microthyrium microscopicum]|uniref:PLD phosphodiesterase domain-containing protein n=1 Tax=Microthyrium microscopicum TaxID=703497 RepID=A0A6A6UFL0_9PEZI|nr:hypothetical protein BT63DRAFT_478411 [Microthyrium microscopicum]